MADPATNESELREGVMLGGKYRLEAEIGRGAMGTVWAAMHDTLGQRVAVKIISQEHANSEELRRRFDTEARAAAKLRSRFVVGVYDNGVTPAGLPYIVMEYLEGECLEDRIARQGSIPVAEASRISRHICRALSKAHSRGIIHRDLKPANIFITHSDDEDDGDDWTAKVLDFGIAKMEDFSERSTTKTGTVLGTPLFMSPEQVRGASDVDPRADLYSLGMLIYNMLTGTYAFEGQSFGDLLVSICTDPLPQLSRSAPDAPPALDAWFQKACAREPDDRYQTADELMKALSEAIGDTTPSTRLSVSDVNASAHLIPLAETFAANSDVAQSGSRQVDSASVDTGASAHTVHGPPEKKSRFPFIIGGAAVALAIVVGLATSGSGAEADAVGASQAIPEEIVSDAANADPAAVVDLDAAPAATNEDPSDNEAKTDAAADEADDPEGDEADSDDTQAKAATPAPRPKATWKPPPKPKATAPAPRPKPAPKPASSEPDLGF